MQTILKFLKELCTFSETIRFLDFNVEGFLTIRQTFKLSAKLRLGVWYFGPNSWAWAGPALGLVTVIAGSQVGERIPGDT